jgi:hypothetical protein
VHCLNTHIFVICLILFCLRGSLVRRHDPVDGRRYGFVGKNGTGKSTLLNAIAFYKLEDFPKHIRVLIVEQVRVCANL